MVALEPSIVTIFGITGDLSRRKLLPALYHLANDNMLPENIRIVGISRRGTTTQDVIENIKQSVEKKGDACNDSTLKRLQSIISIVAMDITQDNEYVNLKKELDRIEDSVGMCLHRLFYLAIPSTLFGPVVLKLGANDLNTGCQHGKAESRLLIEKPFGYDLTSAKELISDLNKSFSEDQIYRIDHYLAKETAQNIMTLRFENPLFSDNWNSKNIDYIMVTAAESIGIEGRASFYEQMGALRDLIQSHLLQLVALVTMDMPETMTSENIHKVKEDLLKTILPPKENLMVKKTVRGQYDSYKSETENAKSSVETFAAVELEIDSPRWLGTPIYVRTGKALADKITEITVVFKDDKIPHCNNYLTIRIQPNEGIVLDLRIKKPGFNNEISNVQMDFCYETKDGSLHPDAYERVLIDAMKGDKALFATSIEVLENWRITQPILDAWENNLVPLNIYKSGTWGPEESEKLLSNKSAVWFKNDHSVCTVHILPNDHKDKKKGQ